MTDQPSGSSEQPRNTRHTSAGDPETVDKVEDPQAHFDHPAEVVIDPVLSKDEKVQALEGLEQDARQLSAAAAEGMAGGDEGSVLPDVLTAKEALDQPPFERAVSVVLQSLRAKFDHSRRAETRASITRAIEALEAASAAVATDGEN
jgi:hypothetical protein